MSEKELFTSVADKEPLSKKIAAQIENAILNKEIAVGEKLPSENELCNQFNVSRTSIREAIKILITQGIVEVQKGKGIFVKNPSSENVTEWILKFYKYRLNGAYARDLIHARQAIEPDIAYYAALNRTDKDLATLERDLELFDNSKNDSVLNTKYDMAFHVDLAKASKNNLFIFMVKPLHQLIPPLKFDVISTINNAYEVTQEWHEKIMDAVRQKDAVGAKKAMKKHLEFAEEHINIILNRK